jgi:cytochrome c-type biogenesis protein CcmH
MRRLLLSLMLALFSLSAHGDAFTAVDFGDPAKEQRYRSLLHELRCTVCQNQSLADSNADLATDLRREVERMVAAGADRDEVIAFMVARYGDFVLYRPPFRASTAFLWLGPFLLLVVGVIIAHRVARGSRGAAPASPDLIARNRSRAERLLRSERG